MNNDNTNFADRHVYGRCKYEPKESAMEGMTKRNQAELRYDDEFLSQVEPDFIFQMRDEYEEVVREMKSDIQGYDMRSRKAIATIAAFINHARNPDFFALPDLDDAQDVWEKLNEHNVAMGKAYHD